MTRKPVRARAADKACSAEGCDRQVHARGMCNTHYVVWWRSEIRAPHRAPGEERINVLNDKATVTLERVGAESVAVAVLIISTMKDPAMAAECRDRLARLHVALTDRERAVRLACRHRFGTFEPTDPAQARFIDSLRKTV